MLGSFQDVRNARSHLSVFSSPDAMLLYPVYEYILCAMMCICPWWHVKVTHASPTS
jgi:hypothetical protein